MVLTTEEKQVIKDASIWLNELSSDPTARIHDKEEFFNKLRYLLAVTPMIQGYGIHSKTLSELSRIQDEYRNT